MDLKYYALGYERAGGDKVRDIASPLPGYRSRLQITADLFAKGIERENKVMARLWIVCDSVFVTSSEKAMRIDSVRVKIHARQMGIANGKELEDIADADTVTALFTQWFQSNYFVLAQRHPELAAVVENTKALAIARWMAARKLEPQEGWATMLLPTVETSVVGGPALVRRDTLVRTRPNGKDILIVQLAGGVEMSGALVETRLATAGSSPKSKAQTSSPALGAKLEASLASGKSTLRPLKDDWLKSVRTRKSDGREWTIGADGLPTASVDAKGRRIRYASNGKSIGAASALTEHAKATLERTEAGYSLEYQDQERYLAARYDTRGVRTALWEFPRRVQVPAGR
ncbi:MAG TPA: hypothetical protein PKY05_20035, partial [Fibrobacteria bacterium]|nr:hypothetical protein [Fibrobacteria bacterium]